jgi:ribonuclease HI
MIYTDGGSRKNPGEAGCGIVIYDDDKKICEISKYLGIKTNNEAEYSGVVLALEKMHSKNLKEAILYSDSQLLVKQLNGEYKVKAEKIIPLNRKVKMLLQDLKVTFEWVRREQNKEADELANIAMDTKKDFEVEV